METKGPQTMNTRDEPSRAEVDTLAGSVLLEFGATHCGHCRAAQSLIAGALASHPHGLDRHARADARDAIDDDSFTTLEALADHPQVRHIKVEDGSGRPLGRSFRVKLWPTLVFLRDGREVARLVRPADPAAIEQALVQVGAAAPS